MADTTPTRGGQDLAWFVKTQAVMDAMNLSGPSLWAAVTGGLYIHGYNMAVEEFRIERMWLRELSNHKQTGTITLRRPTREAANG